MPLTRVLYILPLQVQHGASMSLVDHLKESLSLTRRVSLWFWIVCVEKMGP